MGKYTLSIIQVLTVFFLGVFGNKVAEFINVPPFVVIIFTCLLIALSILLESNIFQRKEQEKSTSAPTQTVGWFPLRLNRLATVAPFGMILGALFTLFAYYTFPFPYFPKLSVRLYYGYEAPGVGPYFYEIVAYIVACVSLFIFSSKIHDETRCYVFSLGLSLGIVATISVFDPYQPLTEINSWISLILWVFMLIISTTLILKAKKTLYALIEFIFRERT